MTVWACWMEPSVMRTDACNLCLRISTVKQLKCYRDRYLLDKDGVAANCFPADCGNISNGLRGKRQPAADGIFQRTADEFPTNCGEITSPLRNCVKTAIYRGFQEGSIERKRQLTGQECRIEGEECWANPEKPAVDWKKSAFPLCWNRNGMNV